MPIRQMCLLLYCWYGRQLVSDRALRAAYNSKISKLPIIIFSSWFE